MEAALQLDGLEFAPDPFRGECPSCGLDVLAVEVDGREVVVDVDEVVPEHDCPQCAQVAGRGHKRSGCLRCGDTGLIGETLPLRGVAIDAYGEARLYVRDAGRAEGEAIHVFHVCPIADDV